MFTTLRIVVGISAVVAVAVGLALIAAGGPPAISGLWLVATGAIGLVAILLERTRYRSEDAERHGHDPGIAGVDGDPVGSRFRRTDERFVDPTTHRAVRVWVHPSSGERRYRLDE